MAVIGGVRLASAAVPIGFDRVWPIRFYDGSGNLIPWVSTDFEVDSVPSHFYDDKGNWYHCVEPFGESFQGTDAKNPTDAVPYYTQRLGEEQAEEFVRRLGYGWRWCDANFSGDYCGLARQLLIWEIEFAFGLKGESYGPGSYNPNYVQVETMVVEYDTGFINSDVIYDSFMNYYNSLTDKGQGVGWVMVPENNALSQKVGRFDIVENGSVKVTKQATNPDETELENERFHFVVTFSGSGAPATEEFDLAAGGSWQMDNIPAGVVANVTEVSDDDYDTTSDPESHEVVVVAGHGADNPVTISFSNSRKTGGVTISKQVEGSQTDHQFSFHLVVKRGDDTVYRTEDFKLRSGESVTFDSIPSGYSYEVTEENEASFRLLSFDGSTGEIPVGSNANALAKNESYIYMTLVKGVGV